jgi:hypothetical protein
MLKLSSITKIPVIIRRDIHNGGLKKNTYSRLCNTTKRKFENQTLTKDKKLNHRKKTV